MLLFCFFQDVLTEGFAELVGAGCRFCAAANALQAVDHLSCIHTFDERADALKVAVAASEEVYILDATVVVDFYFKCLATSAFSAINEFHNVCCVNRL